MIQYSFPERKFTEEHEWLLLKDDASDVATVGVSDFAQSQLGDMVYVELPEVGRAITKGEEMMVLESVKAASDVYAPVDGEVVEVNNALEERPELVNSSPYDKGWLFTMKVADVSSLDSLMNEKEYEKFIEGQE
ncbi:Glycine cleavage system H protein, mitochondrial [Holothuria leucospilota]|uniref:Glycine cleavage system H protein n=1 Tax=Holothuria leucospilota TaxID=206669 RepID=A0A9Q1CB98_HOLLE|nr:Glycine cleavage system H protein, mitochondrial [Holothuria leucospilota]